MNMFSITQQYFLINSSTMAPRNNKNKMIDEAECSAAANKMKRSENLHGMNGLTFRSPVANDNVICHKTTLSGPVSAPVYNNVHLLQHKK
ncbi:hypothetical protein HanRHA438_Chr07g0305621 [Helianthus annuus]|nr:hypothetical protein HanHA300_Chr07g0242871 [Helianthus annuus]KAJ0563170.1 hypothetical protein HanHA89_Chr07g0260061 [Helianthus annuus]KAJ0728538.1 hypothetical protein HanLR1_Chr07g0242751 [Helianthus annuus]KAJ0908008.1 hypothetical protein HanRHA438_Chr07g0305621 [Helianthus annuus]